MNIVNQNLVNMFSLGIQPSSCQAQSLEDIYIAIRQQQQSQFHGLGSGILTAGQQNSIRNLDLSNQPSNKLSRARDIAKDVRERHPEMQVKKILQEKAKC